MFNNKITKLLIGEIEILKEKVNNPIIGQVFIDRNLHWLAYDFNLQKGEWYKVKINDVSDEIDNKIKIFDEWFDKYQVIFYNDIRKQKQVIEKKYKTEEKE